jgi:SAM-dependent methyltransferase
VNERDHEAAERMRARLERGEADACAASFRAAMLDAAPLDRDEWVDVAFGLGPLPDDGPDLPRGCVPYLQCRVDSLLRVIDLAPIEASDMLVDIGSGAGRAAALIRLLTGATVAGVEVQRALIDVARDLVARLRLDRISFVAADVPPLPEPARTGTIFLLNCPFSGGRLVRLLADLEPVSRVQPIRLCCVDLPLPPCPWLAPIAASGDVEIHRSLSLTRRASR